MKVKLDTNDQNMVKNVSAKSVTNTNDQRLIKVRKTKQSDGTIQTNVEK